MTVRTSCPVLLPSLGEPCERPIAEEHRLGLCEEHSLRMLGKWKGEASEMPAPRYTRSMALGSESSEGSHQDVHFFAPGLCRCGCGRGLGPRNESGLTPGCYGREYGRRKNGKPSLLDQAARGNLVERAS